MSFYKSDSKICKRLLVVPPDAVVFSAGGVKFTATKDESTEKIKTMYNVESEGAINLDKVFKITNSKTVTCNKLYRVIDEKQHYFQSDRAFLDGARVAPYARLIAVCHGKILRPIPVPCEVHRYSPILCGISSIGNATSMQSIYEDVQRWNFTHKDFVEHWERKIVAHQEKHFLCTQVSDRPEINESRKKFRQRCGERPKVFKHLFHPDKNGFEPRIFDKFYSNSKGMNFLMLGYSNDKNKHYRFRNLLGLTTGIRIHLSDIFNTYIPHCKHLTIVDFSCSSPSKMYPATAEELDTHGGTLCKKKKGSYHRKITKKCTDKKKEKTHG